MKFFCFFLFTKRRLVLLLGSSGLRHAQRLQCVKAELADGFEGDLEQQQRRAFVAIDDGMAAGQADVEDEAFVLIGQAQPVAHALGGAQVAARIG